MKEVWKPFESAPKDGTWILVYPSISLKINGAAPMVVKWGRWMEPSKYCPNGSGKPCWRDTAGTKYKETTFAYWTSISPKPSPKLFDE